jgi:GDPmannose 4,6-dehydratase
MKAIIFGVNGQDGSYLSELLLEHDYDVVGVTRRSSTDNTERLRHILTHKNFRLSEGDVTDFISVSSIINDEQPDEVYNLAAQSHVATSFNEPIHTWRVDAEGPLNILESVRRHAFTAKFYQASTSEMFGNAVDQDGYQRETTPFEPQSPYAIAKLAAHHKVRIYREAYGLYACSGILFNHESERRGEKFVSRKVTKWVAEFKRWSDGDNSPYDSKTHTDKIVSVMNPENSLPKLRLGNLDASRDWGYAKDYVKAMWLMLQQDEPKDYVIATGTSRTVRDFVRMAFDHIGVSEWEELVVIDREFYRPAEVEFLHGDANRAKTGIGWRVETPFNEMVKRMVEHDINISKSCQNTNTNLI